MPRSLLTALAVFAAPLAAQTISDGYEVATWSGFRSAAVTHTFDDATANQIPVAAPLFDEVGLKATFFVTTDWVGDWPGIAAAAARGHEVTVHTVSHPDLSALSIEEQRFQFEGARDVILANVPGAEALTLAYPFCVPGDRGLVEELFIAARVCSGQVDRATPVDFYATSSVIVGTEGGHTTAEALNAWANAAAAQGGWVTYLSHGVDNDGGWSPVPSDALRAHVEYLAASPDRFWVATYADVVRYIRERDAASVTEVSATGDAVVVEVTDSLDDTIYNVPVTIRRVLPEGWESAVVAQDGEPVTVAIVEASGHTFVAFDAVPDGGVVVLTRAGGTSAVEVP